MADKTDVKVLIVDDSVSHRSQLRRFLEELGNQVVEASTGMEALSMYGDLRPDIVALDRVMPELDGVTTLARLRQVDPNVKVVMVSSSNTVAEMLEAREAGAKGFLLKPLRREKVEQAIRKLQELGK
ncbi:MAG: response regulator [Deltaproteobacteria bacterium]|nr:response regulator [Deltaproteobacteria bacterium]MBI3293243.1 response regulator [Deltaproteobacteria bacterium]